jgi:RND superfamily putative drug exporter
LRALGGRCADHPFVVIVSWLVVTVGTTLLALTVGGDYSKTSTLPGTEVQAAEELLARTMPAAALETADIVVHATDPAATAAAVPAVTRAVAVLPHVVPSSAPVRWSADRRTALVPVQYDAPRFTLGHGDLAALERAVRVGGAETYVSGSLERNASKPSSGLGEQVGIAAAVLVLLVVVGAVIAAPRSASSAAAPR